MTRPTAISKRDLRAQMLAALLINPDGSLRCDTLSAVYRLDGVKTWGRLAVFLAVQDLDRAGRIRLAPAFGDVRITPAGPPPQAELFAETGA